MKTSSSTPILVLMSVLAGVGLTACQQDPFPEAREDIRARIVPNRPHPTPVAVPFAIDVPSTLEFREGSESAYVVRGYVPQPGKPLLEVVEAPDGLSLAYDGVKDQTWIRWTPNFDMSDPDLRYKKYSLKLRLGSSVEPNSFVEERVDLIVRDTPRAFEIEAPALVATEGESLYETLTLENADFPSGPFSFMVSGLPTGATLSGVSGSPGDLVLRLTADPKTVSSNDDWDYNREAYYRDFKFSVSAYDPAARRTSKDLTLRVYDKALTPMITAPLTVSHRSNVLFRVMAEDRNLEAAPTITALTTPAFGRLTLKPSSISGAGRVGAVDVQFDQIPVEHYGETLDVTFKACVRSRRPVCSTQTVTLRLEDETRNPPLISRTAWPMGKIEYLRVGESRSYDVSVFAGTTGDRFNVSLSGSDEATWDGRSIVLRPRTPGLKQLLLTARTPDGRSSSETFLVQALPQSWSSILALGASLRDQDMPAFLQLFAGAQLFNPLMQDLDERMMALRTRLLLGTSALSDSVFKATALQLLSGLRDAVVASPLLGDLDGSFAAELARAGVQVSRLRSVVGNAPSLNDMPMVVPPGSPLSTPTRFVKLGGTLTSASSNPAVFTLRADSSCKALLTLRLTTSDGDNFYPVLVSCRRASGGQLLLSGFEWGDLKPTSNDDSQIPSRWMTQALDR